MGCVGGREVMRGEPGPRLFCGVNTKQQLLLTKLLMTQPIQPSPRLVTKRINTKFTGKPAVYVGCVFLHNCQKLKQPKCPWVNAMIYTHMEMSSATEMSEQLTHITAWTNRKVREARPQSV